MKVKFVIYICAVFSLIGCNYIDWQNQKNNSQPRAEGKKTPYLYAVIYANGDRIIAKEGPFPGKIFKASFKIDDPESLNQARKEIEKGLNRYYGSFCVQVAKKSCSLEHLAQIDFIAGRVEIFNCPECQGSNASPVPGIYHIAPWDDAPEVGSKLGNEHVGAYDSDSHIAFEQIQKNPIIIQKLKDLGYRWGL